MSFLKMRILCLLTLTGVDGALPDAFADNGCMQRAGRQYAARDVRYRLDDGSAELQLNVAAACPKEAGTESWVRNVRLDRGRSVTVSDTFALQKKSSQISESLMTPCEVSRVEAGRLELRQAQPDLQQGSARRVLIHIGTLSESW